MRDEYKPAPTADEKNRAMAESARETDIEIAVRAEKQNARSRGMTLSDDAALNNVYTRIDVDGVEAVLPRFAKITGRMLGQSYEGDNVPRRVRTYQSTPAGAEVPTGSARSEADEARSEIMKLNAENKADLAAGRSPKAENYQRIDELQRSL